MTLSSTPSALRSRGMRDLLPDDMRAFRRVTDAFRASASHWGYDEIRTPTIETYGLFTAAGGLTPEMLSRVYTFLDWDGWSGERVVLRPDSTIPVARAAAEANLPLPARLFYVQQVFRFSNTDDREDWQCGIEFFGAPETLGDLEVASVACETLEALGQQPTVRLAHVGITRAVTALLESQGAGPQRALLDRVAADGFGALRPSLNGDARLAAFVETVLQRDAEIALLANAAALAGDALPEAARTALDDLRRLAAALAESGRRVAIDLAMPHDFEYYTGVVFEFDADGHAWGHGGRYVAGGDLMAAPACGFALDAGRLASYLAPSTARRRPVTIQPLAADDVARALTLARALHGSGITAVLGAVDDSAPVAVVVSSEGLTARTPDGDTAMTSLDELVGLLVQYK